MERAAIAVGSALITAALIFGASSFTSFIGPYLMGHPRVLRLAPYVGMLVFVIVAPTIAKRLRSASE